MRSYDGAVAWRVPIAIQLAWGLILFIGFAFSPESPSYFAKKGDYDACRSAIARLRGVDENDME